jgi:MSHA biogenesis protein MshQ
MRTTTAARCHGLRTTLLRCALAMLLLGALAQPVRAQIGFVQSSGMFGTPEGTVATSPAFSAPPTVGNTIVVLIWTWTENNAANILISDTAGNSYSVVSTATILQNGNWYESASVYMTPVVATGPGFAVTVTTPANDYLSQSKVIALEYSGVGAVDQVNAVTGSTGSATVTTPGATSSAQELVVSAVGVDNPATYFNSITPSGAFTEFGFEPQNAGDTAGAGAAEIVNASGVQSITWTANPSLSGWAAAIATFSPGGGPSPDHYALSDAGSAVNCQPAPVTISAHNSAHGDVATTDTITLNTSTSHGDWSLGSGGGTFVAGPPNTGTATYTYVTADDGVATLNLSDTVPETVSIHVTSGVVTESSGTALPSEHLPLLFSPSGFRITNGSNVATPIGTQVAGLGSTQSLALQAIRTDTQTGACTAAFASGRTVNLSVAFQCNNPTSCLAGQTLSLSNNATTTSIAPNPASGITAYTTVPMQFSTANAEAPFSLAYSDVGQITLAFQYNLPLGSGSPSGSLMTGASQFVVQPYSFTLSAIRCTNYGAGTCAGSLAAPGNNPGASAPAGPAFLPAGQPFSATVTAINAQGAATPNYGQEIGPQGVQLTPNLVLPAGGDAAPIGNPSGFGAFSAGIATGTAFSWPEVGIITLTPSVASYLGTGPVTGTSSGNVGRFIPNGFAVALNTPVFATGCAQGTPGDYTYVGQPFTYAVPPVITLTAQALGGATTQNYTGAFLRLTNGSLTGRSYTPTPASPALTLTGLPPASADPGIADLGAGQSTLTFSAGSGIAFTRGSPIAPFAANIALSINVIDLDGVTAPNPVTFGAASGISFSTSANQYYGRLALRDAAGSELLDLPAPLTTEYYLGAAQGFTTNLNDSCTVAPAIAFSNYQLNLQPGQTCVRDTGTPGRSGVGCAVPAAISEQYGATATNGSFNLHLAGPGSGNSGAVTVTPTAPPWLQFLWNAGSGTNSNPSGMATFGVFPGPPSRVYQREVY